MAVVVPFPGGKHRLYTQLDTGAPTRKQDCQVLVVINNILSASRGRVGPKSKSEVKTWIRMVRRWANRPTGALKLRTHVLSAYRHPELKAMFREAGLSPLKASLRAGIDWNKLKKEHVLRGEIIHLVINYGTVNKNRPKPPSGDIKFKGGHAVGFLGFEQAGGYVWVNLGDPLFDGRKPIVPKGWQVCKYSWLKEPAGRFGSKPWGVGRAEAITIKVSKLLESPVDEPTPVPDFDFEAAARVLEDMAAQMREQKGR